MVITSSILIKIATMTSIWKCHTNLAFDGTSVAIIRFVNKVIITSQSLSIRVLKLQLQMVVRTTILLEITIMTPICEWHDPSASNGTGLATIQCNREKSARQEFHMTQENLYRKKKSLLLDPRKYSNTTCIDPLYIRDTLQNNN